MPQLVLLMEAFNTPTGEMRVLTDENGVLRILEWTSHEDRLHRLAARHYGENGYRIQPNMGPPTPARLAMDRYYSGDIHAIDRLETATNGTAFQKSVWSALRQIPAGTTWSYGQLAAHIDNPAAVRAVGLANGANPIGIVVPCHRVIGANGKLTGYGGGMERKQWLLQHEGALARQPQGDLLGS